MRPHGAKRHRMWATTAVPMPRRWPRSDKAWRRSGNDVPQRPAAGEANDRSGSMAVIPLTARRLLRGDQAPREPGVDVLGFGQGEHQSSSVEHLPAALSGEFASIARALIERYERQFKAEQAALAEERKRQEELRIAAEVKRLEEGRRMREAALAEERRRTEEIKDIAEAKWIEEQRRAEIIARTEELRKAHEAVRAAREAATAAEQQRLAAVKAAEEANERAKTASLRP